LKKFPGDSPELSTFVEEKLGRFRAAVLDVLRAGNERSENLKTLALFAERLMF
jgi:hypothetical protein